MQKFPHHYRIAARAEPEGDVDVGAQALSTLATASPAEFGGPGDRWSPETLLVAAVADCFVLSFRAVAAASKLAWQRVECEVEGILDRQEGCTRFTTFEVKAKLSIPSTTPTDKAQSTLEKAKSICLISNSLSGTTHLVTEITTLTD
ncbi:MAG TPA: OsmC family protein [Motiliproteus sp.]